MNENELCERPAYILYIIPHGIFEITTVLQSAAGIMSGNLSNPREASRNRELPMLLKKPKRY
ncbi:MAG: hypothetical protein UIB31_07145 [Methanobrevibacter sp.]|nr:hypothetical protein [Methanobrevibacter sp.]